MASLRPAIKESPAGVHLFIPTGAIAGCTRLIHSNRSQKPESKNDLLPLLCGGGSGRKHNENKILVASPITD